ncbi:hypothetical protein D3C84_970360 [compost metagenome]
MARLVALALSESHLGYLAAQFFVQQVYADIFDTLHIAAQVGFFLAKSVVPLRTLLSLQTELDAGAGLHRHNQAFVGQCLQQFGHAGTNRILAAIEVINQQVSQHVGGGPHSAVGGGI